MQERGKNVLSHFAETTTQGINNSDVLQMLTTVKSYWKDNLRPTLISLCCEAIGGKSIIADDASLMVTLISAGMGIHDDIIDKSSNKHFRSTLSGLYGFDNSLVIGDLLIVKAISAIREIIKKTNPEKALEIILAYENAFVEMCEGELMEISFRKRCDFPIESYNHMLWKFGADTEVCAKIGAILGNGSDNQIEKLSKYGKRIGFAYRLLGEVRDCLNIEGNLPERLLNESIPLPILFASKASKDNCTTIQRIFKQATIHEADIENLLKLCFDSEAFQYINRIYCENDQEIENSLTILPASEAKNALLQITKEYKKDFKSILPS